MTALFARLIDDRESNGDEDSEKFPREVLLDNQCTEKVPKRLSKEIFAPRACRKILLLF